MFSLFIRFSILTADILVYNVVFCPFSVYNSSSDFLNHGTSANTPNLEKMTMKHLVTLTLIAVLGFAVVGCNKSKKVNASTTAAQCDFANCDKANCDKAKCDKANCDKAKCAAKAAQAKPAAAGDAAKSCCSSKTKPAAAGANNPADCNPADCASKKKGTGCPMSGGQ